MFRFYTPLLILQAICLYHAYRNNAEQRWYWLIAFIPGIGCAIYLIDNFYNRKNINSLSEGVKEVMNSNYKIEKLEKELKFSETLSNKSQLAEAYTEIGRYPDAIILYNDCLSGYMSDDPILQMKLLQVYYLQEEFENAIRCGHQLQGVKQFKNSLERVSFALSLHHMGKTSDAEEIFRDLDKPFTNYKHRVAFCKFLSETNPADQLKNKLAELREELEHMKGPERKLYRDEMREIKTLSAKLG